MFERQFQLSHVLVVTEYPRRLHRVTVGVYVRKVFNLKPFLPNNAIAQQSLSLASRGLRRIIVAETG